MSHGAEKFKSTKVGIEPRLQDLNTLFHSHLEGLEFSADL